MQTVLDEILKKHSKLEAIKALRKFTGLGLMFCKEAVEKRMAMLESEHSDFYIQFQILHQAVWGHNMRGNIQAALDAIHKFYTEEQSIMDKERDAEMEMQNGNRPKD